ncbi:MAG: ATP-binding protein [Planctomycetes bacterium]|jgi:transitional endoplasmic reticulum ATPase|nr:ATP-binding protein [Planctomycetota bacterium]
MTSFLFDTYKQHHDEGIAAHKAGDYPKARLHYLMAAKYLCALAKEAGAEFKQERLKKAQRLMEIARELEGRQVQRHKGAKGGDAWDSVRHVPKVPTEDDEEEAQGERWIVSDPPKTSFEDVAGLEDVKRAINLRVIYPLRHPEATSRFRKRAGGGVLLYGPPGTGKTMIARAVACELDAAFFSVKCSDIMSKWVGTAERNIKELFASARGRPRSVIFMDETEAIVSRRGGGSTVMDRVIPEFLAQVDGLEKRENMLLLLGATNRPWDMDEAALRPGRFDELIYVPLPDKPARLKILELNLQGVPRAADVILDELAERVDGYSGADIQGFTAVVTDYPYQRQIETGQEQMVTRQDVAQALGRAKPSVNDKMLARYEQYRRDRGLS